MVGWMSTYGTAARNEKRKAVLNQLMAVSDTWKYCAASMETGEKVNHCVVASQCLVLYLAKN